MSRTAVFGTTNPITWEDQQSCFSFWKDQRLCATQVWFGNGGESAIIFFGIYGPSGARWDSTREAYFYRRIQAIDEGASARGDLPLRLIGDFNMPMPFSSILKRDLRHQKWKDARDLRHQTLVINPLAKK